MHLNGGKAKVQPSVSIGFQNKQTLDEERGLRVVEFA